MSQKIYIACDHAGFELKQYLIEQLQNSFEIIDCGCDSAENSVDYPDFANYLCQKMASAEKGILICGSGVGISIAANRFKHIRAALCHNEKSAKLSRNHNDANVIALGARILSKEENLKLVQIFLSENFESGRHEIRVEKLSK